MPKALRHLLAGTRGGESRARLVRATDDRPRNAGRLGEALDLRYDSVRCYLEKLEDHDIVETGGEDYDGLPPHRPLRASPRGLRVDHRSARRRIDP